MESPPNQLTTSMPDEKATIGHGIQQLSITTFNYWHFVNNKNTVSRIKRFDTHEQKLKIHKFTKQRTTKER